VPTTLRVNNFECVHIILLLGQPKRRHKWVSDPQIATFVFRCWLREDVHHLRLRQNLWFGFEVQRERKRFRYVNSLMIFKSALWTPSQDLVWTSGAQKSCDTVTWCSTNTSTKISLPVSSSKSKCIALNTETTDLSHQNCEKPLRFICEVSTSLFCWNYLKWC